MYLDPKYMTKIPIYLYYPENKHLRIHFLYNPDHN